jgi:hypothetical protein
MSVDWSKPIEAVHEDGRVVAAIMVGQTRVGWLCRYGPYTNGIHHYADGRANISNGWTIRNVEQTEDPDNVNSPSHYSAGSGIECIDAIRAALTPEEFRGYCKGNMLKYVWRERNKGGDESLKKAAKYVEFALEKADV